MDVRCPQCDTLYEIDARQLRGGAATLRCSQCDHVFRLQTNAALSRENQRRWMVKNTTSGDILYFSGFDQLHEWILQGKVAKTDQVSRTGKVWQRLEAIGEFRPIFQAVESISSISASHAAEQSSAAERSDLGEDGEAGSAAEGSAPSDRPDLERPEPSRPASEQPAPNQPAPNQPAASQPAPAKPRPKVKTSPQFGAQGPSARDSSPAIASAPDLSESSRPEPNHTPVGPARSQTPPPPQRSAPSPDERAQSRGDQPTRNQPARNQPASNQPANNQPASNQPASNQPAGNQRSGSQPKVRLQTGAFGGASTGPDRAQDEDWSFGDGSTLGEAEGAETSGVVEYNEGGGSRWPIVMVVAVLLVASGGAGVYFLRPDLLEKYLPQQADQDVVTIAGSDEEGGGDDDAPKAAEIAPDELLQAAVSEALGSATAANASRLGAAADAARPKVFASLEVATEAATKAAEEPDADEILASAKRSLERGDPTRARQKFHQVIDLDRNNAEAITGLGWSLLALGSPGAASAQFRKALSYNPSYGDAYIGLGKSEREQGNHQAALKAYQDYLNRFPGGRKASIASYQADKLKKTLGQ
jgi:predicted Zn finger-like uncharacterized protein